MPAPSIPVDLKQRAIEEVVRALMRSDRWCLDLKDTHNSHFQIPQAASEAAIVELLKAEVVEVVEQVREFKIRKLRLTGKPVPETMPKLRRRAGRPKAVNQSTAS